MKAMTQSIFGLIITLLMGATFFSSVSGQAASLVNEQAVKHLRETGGYDSLRTAFNDARKGSGDKPFRPEVSQTKLIASDGAAVDLFGFRVAISGDTAIVGSYADDIGANANQGSAYVFVRNGTTWTQQTKLTASDGAASDNFGFSVAISGDTAIVGSFADDIGANANQGSAYVFNSFNTRTLYDFDGDGKADVSVFRPSNGGWYINQSLNGFTGIAFGQAGDRIVPADYDGDGKTDVAVYRNGTWYLNRSVAGFTAIGFGTAEDIPQPADFDNDGRAELAVFRPSNGYWYVLNLQTNQFSFVQFGQNGDKPVVADYDGDGRADYAVYRNGSWYILRSSQGFIGIQFGITTDKPVPADYDGDGKADVAVFRQSNGTWYLNRSLEGFAEIQFGITTDVPAPADYDGDGRADIAVFRDGAWYLQRSTSGFFGIQFGATADRPVPSAFVP